MNSVRPVPVNLLALHWRDYNFERACLVVGGQTMELTEKQRKRMLCLYREACALLGRAPKLGDYIFTNDNNE